MDEYLVPTDFGEDEFIEKKSRFIGRLWPVETEEAALEKIQAMKKQHYDATHNCWAYIIRDGAVRFSDDGEPGGTAGMPMLQVLQREGLFNCVCVVTRYFGGILLGTGGLVRAYSTSARDALAAAQRVLMCECCEYEIDCEYGNYDRLSRLIADCCGMIQNTDFTDKVTVNVMFKKVDTTAFLDKLCETFASKIIAKLKNTIFSNIFEKNVCI